MREGVRLALDLGDARIGVAACDHAAMLSFPVATIQAGDGELERILAVVEEYAPVEVVVGLPRSLSGQEGPAAARIRVRTQALADRVSGLDPAPDVRLVDERLTTVDASRRLREAGKNSRKQRSRIDAAAAVGILEHALEAERHRGFPPGELVSATVPSD
ncbi:Holliday junction resolvase RuvX [Microlunatus ginsengisoli]|uniref:Putative pre-16S rRNA nuclease n=1 Tax=Microlunatus ginsengisoli TaxID=363863 RepID=A0ABP7ADW6_9ACTN